MLYQIAANVCASTLRSQLGGADSSFVTLERSSIAQVEQPEREAVLDLTAAVRDLPDRQRRALLLRDWQGLHYDEIATKMAVSRQRWRRWARNNVGATLERRDWKPKLATSARAARVALRLHDVEVSRSERRQSSRWGSCLPADGRPLVAFGASGRRLRARGKGEGAKPPSQGSVLQPTLPIPR